MSRLPLLLPLLVLAGCPLQPDDGENPVACGCKDDDTADTGDSGDSAESGDTADTGDSADSAGDTAAW